ncbi:MAG TPA: hypothetical protein VK983_01060 [Candidatus Limnocylindrales bacterium]|nr:hypothetical protein [Candidatus Limnocylindrales bacterium]
MNALTIKKALITGVSALSLSVLAAPVAFAQTSGGTNTQNRPAAPAQTQPGQPQPAQTQAPRPQTTTPAPSTTNQATGKNNATSGTGAAASGAAQTGAGTTAGIQSEAAIVTGVVALVAASAIAATRKRESYEA